MAERWDYASQRWPNNKADNTSYQAPQTSYENATYEPIASPSSQLSSGPISPSTTMPYGDVYATNNPLSMEDTTGRSTIRSEGGDMSQAAKPTPSTLGWSLDSVNLHYYKFVIVKGSEPYFDLIPGYPVTPTTPQRVYLDEAKVSTKNVYPCQYPSECADAIFKRPADLERHYRNVHATPDPADRYSCDYPSCERKREPFTRKDHFRDHLRDFHREDIGSAKGEKKIEKRQWLALQARWIAERKIYTKWWRCLKCFKRVQIADSGYECQSCNYALDSERIGRIEVERRKSEPASASKNTEMEGIQYGPTPEEGIQYGPTPGEGIQYGPTPGEGIQYGTASGRDTVQYDTAPGRGTAQYDTALGRGTTQYDTALGRGTAQYETATGRGTAQYDTALGRSTIQYDTAPGRSTVQYDTAPGRSTTQYDIAPGRGIAQYDTAPGRGTAQYDTAPGRSTVQYDTAPGRGTVQYDTASAVPRPVNCGACRNTAWIWNSDTSAWDACQTCQPALPPQYYNTNEDWGTDGRVHTPRY